ncbi:MAG TPA: glycerol-3-phosphate 1-O-acyltransferase PlsY [Bacteroidia bacterium]|nr:glycerol-3-phosphate 1-O-acyltransferase PlsY [Bacteroidia bacterium]
MTALAILGLLLAYLAGSVPSSVWIGKGLYGIDIREHGSGNAGATNAFRVLGKKAGIPVLLIDVLKGLLVVLMTGFLTEAPPHSTDFVNIQLALGIAAVIGHIFPVFAGFRGGKGIATLFGVTLAIHPWACLIALGVFILVFLTTNYVSLSSISAGLSLPVIIILGFGRQIVPSMVLFAIMIAILILITHQRNIERLLRREESKLRFRKTMKPQEEINRQ